MRIILLAPALFFTIALTGQQLTQRISGKVTDKTSSRPLPEATITLVDSDPVKSAITNALGEFVFEGVPVGRWQIAVSYVGYEDYVTDYLLISSARETILAIELAPAFYEQDGVVVKAKRNPKLPVNEASVVSTRSFTPEETGRYAAAVNDPGRMAIAFPGVQAIRDARNDIVIRGNSPVSMLWRLEGVDIPNPNHFARKGSSGGGITIFSSSILANSDFSSGGFPAEYGDALSGVFDMHLRKGNNQKQQYTFKASLIGIDFSTEGPMQKGRSSYLVNYRYSTLGLLNQLGFHLVNPRENNTFQDLSFNLNFPSKNNKANLNFWGIGGLSKESYSATEEVKDWVSYDDYAIYAFNTDMGATGLKYNLQTGQQGLFTGSLAIMGQKILFADDTLNTSMVPYRVNDELYKNNRIAVSAQYGSRLADWANFKAGLYANNMGYSFRRSIYDFENQVFRRNLIDGDGRTVLLQPFAQVSLNTGPRLKINLGVHGMYLAFNQRSLFQPRASLSYRIATGQTLSFSTGLYGKMLPLGSYFYKTTSGDLPNKDLDFIRAVHYILAYDLLMKKNWRLRIEGYHQQLNKVPVVNDVNRTFWMLNMFEGYATEPWVSQGKGKNTGVDLTLEKFFSKGWFLISGFSVFNSVYMPLNGKEYNTQYNSKSSGNFSVGKEWAWRHDRVFSVGGKFLYNGGMPIMPLLPGGNNNSRSPVLDETNAFGIRVVPYKRADARLSLRWNKKNTTSMLTLDIQNILAIKNSDALSRRFDPVANRWIFKETGDLVPVIGYQIDF